MEHFKMTLKVYRIDRSFFGKINNRLKKPDLPAMTAGACIGNPFKNARDLLTKDCYVLSKDEEISRFTEAFDDEWIDDMYYIRHPKKTKTDILIPANKFHSYIVREQLADITSYIRANLKIKKLDISITRNNGGSVSANGVIDSIPLEGKAEIKQVQSNKVTILCPTPLKVSEKKINYTWIDEFPHILAMVDEADEGSFKVSEEYDLSFGLGIKIAEQIGIDLTWNEKYAFDFQVTA